MRPQIFAYMPTWRGLSSLKSLNRNQYLNEHLSGILERMDDLMEEDQTIYFSTHYLSDINIEGKYKHIRKFPDDEEKYDTLSKADVLITDDSSAFFDFAITGKPIIMFPFDVEDYEQERGTYFPIEDLPFPIAYNIDELCAIIRENRIYTDEAEYESFKKKFLYLENGNNSENILNIILNDITTDDVEVIDYSKNRERDLRAKFYRYIPTAQNCKCY